MDVIEAIKKRRSIRKFKSTPVPDEMIQTILECGRLAPSAGNRQPWVFVVVKDQAIKDKLVEASGKQMFLGEAPVVIVVLSDAEISGARYEDRGRTLYYIQDAAAAATNMILAATSLGLATVWVGAFKESMVREALDLPSNLRPLTMIPVGYPDQERGPRDLRPFQEVVWFR